jgi:hypothetical protein
MPLSGIRLLFETLVQCTRIMCKCEMREIGSKDCNQLMADSREPLEFARRFLCRTAKSHIAYAGRWTAGGSLLNPPT